LTHSFKDHTLYTVRAKTESDTMNSRYINTKALAKELEEKIVREFRTDFAEERMGDDDIGYTAMLISDAGRMIEICRWIGWGEFDRARELLRDMDTLPRENMMYYIESVAGSSMLDTIFA